MPESSNKIRLRLLGLPPIDSLDDLAALTHLSKGLIFRLCRFSNYYYKVYEIPKRSGGLRSISQPSKEMKALQGWILRNILNRLQVSTACKGFERGVSVVQNALPHCGSNAVLCIDLDNFFHTVKINQVWSVFRTVGYSPRVAAFLASICCFKDHLPQGAATSPKLANLVALRLDSRMLGYVGKKGIVYTRYADDLTFSALSPRKLIACFPFIRHVITSEGFTVNDKKTRLAGPARAHKVTGLVVTDVEVGIGRKRLRMLRAEILDFCRRPTSEASRVEADRLTGWLAYVNSVDKPRRKILSTYISRLKEKYQGSAVSDIGP
jgi:retron-type reverse transcriptase